MQTVSIRTNWLGSGQGGLMGRSRRSPALSVEIKRSTITSIVKDLIIIMHISYLVQNPRM